MGAFRHSVEQVTPD